MNQIQDHFQCSFQLFYFSCLGYPWFKTRHLFFKAWKFIYDHFGSVEENEGKGKTREVKEFWNLCSDDSDDTNKNVMAMLVDKGASDSANDSSSSGNSVGGGDVYRDDHVGTHLTARRGRAGSGRRRRPRGAARRSRLARTPPGWRSTPGPRGRGHPSAGPRPLQS